MLSCGCVAHLLLDAAALSAERLASHGAADHCSHEKSERRRQRSADSGQPNARHQRRCPPLDTLSSPPWPPLSSVRPSTKIDAAVVRRPRRRLRLHGRRARGAGRPGGFWDWMERQCDALGHTKQARGPLLFLSGSPRTCLKTRLMIDLHTRSTHTTHTHNTHTQHIHAPPPTTNRPRRRRCRCGCPPPSASSRSATCTATSPRRGARSASRG